MELLSRLTRPEPFNRYVSRLRNKYSATDVLLAPTQSHSQARRVPLDSLFVKLPVLLKGKLDLGEQDFGSVDEAVRLQSALADIGHPDDAVELEDLFSNDGASAATASSSRLSVTSCAGGGKTTLFLKRAAQEWAGRKLWKQFQLLVALPLRLQGVHKAKDLADLLQLKEMGIIVLAEQTAIIDFIKATPGHMCFIMDGLDEVKMEECSEYVQGVLQGTNEQGVNIIITSRHSKNMFSLQRVFPFDKQYEILGFSPEKIASFVRKRMEAADADCFLEAMAATEQIKSLMCTPVFLSLSCEVFLSTRVLPSSVASLYSAVVLRVVHSSTGRCYSSWSAVPDQTKDCLLEVGAFAYQMLVENRTVFTENEVESFSLSKDAWELQLLVPCASSPFKDMDQSQFPHLSLQEAIAAKFATTLCSTPDDVMRLVRTRGALTGALTTFWVLLAAELSPECLNRLVHAILIASTPTATEDDDDTNDIKTPELINLGEHLAECLTSREVEALDNELHCPLPKGRMVLAHLPKDAGNTLLYLQRLLLRWRCYALFPSKQLLRQAVDKVNPRAAVDCFGPPSTPQLQQREPEVDLCTPEGRRCLLLACRCVSEALAAMRPIVVAASGPVASLSRAFTETGLDLQHIPLSLADCQVLGHILNLFSGSICGVQLSDCRLLDSSMAAMLPGLRRCTALTEFAFQRNFLTGKHAAELGDIILRNAASLRQLYTGSNALGSTDVSSLHGDTQECRGLEEVSLGGTRCGSHAVDLATVEPILARCTQLTRVYFSRCQLGDDGLGQLKPSLQSLKLTRLGLMGTLLRSVSGPILVDIVRASSERIEALNLSYNAIGDEAVQAVSAALQHCSNLQWLYLRKTRITSSSIPSLGNVLRSCSRLTGLYLAGNDLSGGTVADDEQFTAAALESKSLEALGMPSNEHQLVSATLHRQLQAHGKPNFKLKVRFSDY